MSDKMIYYFGKGGADGDRSLRDLLGGKGANLAEMVNLGIPVPAGFTITTEVCDQYYKNDCKFPKGLKEDALRHITRLEEAMGMKFGDPSNPLLVSIRSGAAASMPGMMDTVLNLGLNDKVVEGLAQKTGNPRFAYDSYRRFINMFGDVVMNVDHHNFESAIEACKERHGAKNDAELSEGALKELINEYKSIIRTNAGKDFPEEPTEQLWASIEAVFSSWNNNRAVAYRRIHDIRGLKGTAVNVQSMVYGNMGDSSATGVCFTRDPSTGERRVLGEYLINAQGEDVVAGIRTPRPIEEMEKDLPEPYRQLQEIMQKLEQHYTDMQDIEFTVQENTLYLLQTRSGKRAATSAIKIALDMLDENLIDEKTAVKRVEPKMIEMLLHPKVRPGQDEELLTTGLKASPGAAAGKIVFSSEEAAELGEKGEKVILVRKETTPEDIIGMEMSQGIVTAFGGLTSHAAVVARQMGKPCIVGCESLTINMKTETAKFGNVELKKGETITLDGTRGRVMKGLLVLQEPEFSGDFRRLISYANKYRTMNVRVNADSPEDSILAREKFGAEGIGLCRTEHMFFDEQRIMTVRMMILSDSKEERAKRLAQLKPFQKKDFKGIFEAMQGLPVTIRLLDPPLHEFLPHEFKEQEVLAKEMGISADEVKIRVDNLAEMTPMLGHRGCRLAITHPEIYDMQVQAIVEAACEVQKSGKAVHPEIMIPLVGHIEEANYIAKRAHKTTKRIIKETGVELNYMVGTMIETPRAALIADKLAENLEFFSFGTNDLTQMTYGISRDDVGKFMPSYIEKGIYETDPFATLDQEGVGYLIELAVKKGKATKPDIKLGICGEHGGDPESVIFCHKIGLNYVSCSPYRVPVAIQAAAIAAIHDS